MSYLPDCLLTLQNKNNIPIYITLLQSGTFDTVLPQKNRLQICTSPYNYDDDIIGHVTNTVLTAGWLQYI